MGKISDALEKADTKRSGWSRSRRTPIKSSVQQQEKDNILELPSMQNQLRRGEVDPALITYYTPQAVEAELFKVLRTNLLFPDDGHAPKSILVTSPLPGDGKSFTSANLAISIAQGIEEHVLLIDCDLRKPTIHKLFGNSIGYGLSDFLKSGQDVSKGMIKTPIDKLTILPAGKPPKNPTELLSSKKMRVLLQEVKGRYEDRLVIIDSPPPSMAPETNAIAKIVDGVLLVVKSGKTPRSAVKETIEQIGKEKILGIALNYASQSVKKYYGYGKEYYNNK